MWTARFILKNRTAQMRPRRVEEVGQDPHDMTLPLSSFLPFDLYRSATLGFIDCEIKS